MENKDFPKKLNFPILSVNSAVFSYFGKIKAKFFGYWLLVIAFLFGGSIISNYYQNILPIVDFRWLIISLILYPGIYFLAVRSSFSNEFLRQFAESNGYDFKRFGFVNNLNGILFNIGTDKTTENIISGLCKNIPWQFFDYSYDVDDGIDQETHQRKKETYYFSIFKLEFPCLLAPVVLEPKGLPVLGGPFGYIDGGSKISTTGDFANKFTFHCSKLYEIEALQIFQPDIIDVLARNFGKFMIEFTGSNVFIYSYTNINSKDLQLIFDCASFLINNTLEKAKRISRQVEAMREAQITAPPNGRSPRFNSRPILVFVLSVITAILIFYFTYNQ